MSASQVSAKVQDFLQKNVQFQQEIVDQLKMQPYSRFNPDDRPDVVMVSFVNLAGLTGEKKVYY
ncbi:hypothetical protein H3259_27430, partial [Escherichia coli]|nr:hypothetical protein [Escherichia coli]